MIKNKLKTKGIGKSEAGNYGYYFEFENWIVTISKDNRRLRQINKGVLAEGDIEGTKRHFAFILYFNGVIELTALWQENYSSYQSNGKSYIEGRNKLPIPNFICDFVKEKCIELYRNGEIQ